MQENLNSKKIRVLDCTLRDGGYYNAWDFSEAIINDYLKTMVPAGVNVVEIGLRSLVKQGFKGACAYSTDAFIRSLDIPAGLTIGVMVNASELVNERVRVEDALAALFPQRASESPVKLVRIACHIHEFSRALPASRWLKERGFDVGFNLMQVADRSQEEIEQLAKDAVQWPLDVLYFADSMGGMTPEDVAKIVRWLRSHWKGEIGVHTHDNMGLALSNTLRAIDEGVTWVDSTVAGMGRGPGNTQTERLVLEVAERRGKFCNIVPLLGVKRRHFREMQQHYGWGTNTYYYLAGKYGIHPTFIQEMLGDSRYDEEDILAVIEHLRVEGGKKFSLDTLDSARHFYQGEPRGEWRPNDELVGREVLLLGAGHGIARHKSAIEAYIHARKPFVLALNTQAEINAELINARVACHPIRLLADVDAHAAFPQPLIAPVSMLPEDVRKSLEGHEIRDFGISVNPGTFRFESTYCVLPRSLVVPYALAIAASGQAEKISLAGFDGYEPGDPRNNEMDELLDQFSNAGGAIPLSAITPTIYKIPSTSVYAI